MLEKPPVGAQCNGCGLCCRAEVCSVGSFTMGLVGNYGERAPGPCPAMVDQPDGSVSCGMVARPREYSPSIGGAHELREAIKIMIGAGSGCDEPGDSPEDAEKVTALGRRYLEIQGPERIERAVKRWFGI
jgi:hypothetical protein